MKPRTLFIDIETAPVIAAVWPPLHDPNGVVWIIRPTYILSYAAKWARQKKIKTKVLPDYPRFKKHPHCDKSLLEELHSDISQSDIVVAHNGDHFDMRVIRSRMIINKLPPLPPVKQVDTLKWYRSIGKFDSNRLDALLRALQLCHKLPTRNDLWRRSTEGDLKAFEKMRRYNAHDVRSLEWIFNEIRPWVQNGPDLSIYTGRNGTCSSCGSDNVKKNGFRVARSRKYQEFQCQKCGHYFRGKAIK